MFSNRLRPLLSCRNRIYIFDFIISPLHTSMRIVNYRLYTRCAIGSRISTSIQDAAILVAIFTRPSSTETGRVNATTVRTRESLSK